MFNSVHFEMFSFNSVKAAMVESYIHRHVYLNTQVNGSRINVRVDLGFVCLFMQFQGFIPLVNIEAFLD